MHDEEIRLTESNLKYEKNLRWILSIGILLVIALFLFLLDRSIKTKKQKVIIENQHLKLNRTYKEVKDSIDYAKKIQDALMISEENRLKIFPESFVFFSPKDVVSGDFYWLHSKLKTNEVYFSVADCTGHGVPGAFMSMIGNSVLNEVVVEEGVIHTDEILNHTRDLIKKAFNDNETAKEFLPSEFICDPNPKSIVSHIEKINKNYEENKILALQLGKKYKDQFNKINIAKTRSNCICGANVFT